MEWFLAVLILIVIFGILLIRDDAVRYKRHTDLQLSEIARMITRCERDGAEQTEKLLTSFGLGMHDAMEQIEQMKKRAEVAEANVIKQEPKKPIPWEDVEKELAGRY